MNYIQAILLGALQGFTEFLPVSSSGHLAIAQSLMEGFEQPGMLFDTLLHLATLFAVLIFFRHKVILLIKAFLGLFFARFNADYFNNKRLMWGIVIASIPTGVIGLLLESRVTGLLSNTIYIGYALIFTSILLALSDLFTPRGELSLGKGFLLGVVQGIAVIPGISRSGSTIAAGLMLGIKREEMAEFSFLMSVPAILGATILQMRHIGEVSYNELPIYLAGMAVAFVCGLIAIGFMLHFVKNAKLKYFAMYCLVLGIATVLFL